MDFTGERFVNDGQSQREKLAQEHWARYLFANQFVKDKTVLDIACGEGYGSYYMSKNALKVVGADISGEAVKYATARYVNANLSFEKMSIENISYPEHTFDVVVSFETIEHVDENVQEKAFREYARVLKENGVLIVSTPNTQSPNYFKGNIFHKKELSVAELQKKLKKYFKKIYLFGQSLYDVSVISPIKGEGFPPPKSFEVLDRKFPQFDKEVFEHTGEDQYILAVCSNAKIDDPVRGSILIDRNSIYQLSSKAMEKSYSLIERIFSIKNFSTHEKRHKIITVMGLKIKIKT